MKILYAALFISSIVCACSSTPQSSTADRKVIFACTNGETISVRFLPDETAVLTRNGADIVLPQQRSASGFIYGNGRNTIRGKGDELILEIGRMVPIQCKVKSAT